jgi:hypothetical protein
MRRSLLLCLVVLGAASAWAQPMPSPMSGPGPWVTIQWSYSLAEPLPHIGFVIESCLQTPEGCSMVGQWTVSPLTLSLAVTRPNPGQVRCYQVRAIGPEARGPASTPPLCLGP